MTRPHPLPPQDGIGTHPIFCAVLTPPPASAAAPPLGRSPAFPGGAGSRWWEETQAPEEKTPAPEEDKNTRLFKGHCALLFLYNPPLDNYFYLSSHLLGRQSGHENLRIHLETET